MTCTLRLETEDYEGGTDCDGCGRKIVLGEKYIAGIESCCGGGCERNLCVPCVKRAAELLPEPCSWGRETTLMGEVHLDPQC